MLVLTDPRSSGSDRGAAVRAAARARTSIGSPSAVPVPCASTYATSCGATPALASASRITASCAGPLGAVSPALGPSWFTALPRMIASTRSPSASASDSRFRTTIPQPSPSEKPSAAASKVLQRPSEASMRALEKAIVFSGASVRWTPPATAIRHSPLRRL